MNLIKKIASSLIIDHKPNSLTEVDWEYDENHPIKRFRRQTPGATFLIFLGALLIGLGGYLGSWIIVLTGVALIGVLVFEYHDDLNNGHLCAGELGDYWRHRKEWLDEGDSHAKSSDTKKVF